MDFTTIVMRLNELTTFMNSVVSLSKKIFQLPPSTEGVKLVAVYNQTSLETEQFNLSQALATLNEINDGIIGLGEITRSGNRFIFYTGFYWRINGLLYQNISNVTIIIPLATDGFYRTDIVVLGTNNDIYLIQGLESDTISIQPPTPPNTIFLCYFTIYGDTVYNPSQPTVQGQNNFVRVLQIPENLLSGIGTEEEQICQYILSLQQANRTILETDSKWNIVITDTVIPPTTSVYSNVYNNKYL
jgi:hypothetical protein